MCSFCSKKLRLPETDALGFPLSGNDVQAEAYDLLERHMLLYCPKFQGYRNVVGIRVSRIRIFDTVEGDITDEDGEEENYV